MNNADNRVGGGHAHEPKGRGSTPPTGTNADSKERERIQREVKERETKPRIPSLLPTGNRARQTKREV